MPTSFQTIIHTRGPSVLVTLAPNPGPCVEPVATAVSSRRDEVAIHVVPRLRTRGAVHWNGAHFSTFGCVLRPRSRCHFQSRSFIGYVALTLLLFPYRMNRSVPNAESLEDCITHCHGFIQFLHTVTFFHICADSRRYSALRVLRPLKFSP